MSTSTFIQNERGVSDFATYIGTVFGAPDGGSFETPLTRKMTTDDWSAMRHSTSSPDLTFVIMLTSILSKYAKEGFAAGMHDLFEEFYDSSTGELRETNSWISPPNGNKYSEQWLVARNFVLNNIESNRFAEGPSRSFTQAELNYTGDSFYTLGNSGDVWYYTFKYNQNHAVIKDATTGDITGFKPSPFGLIFRGEEGIPPNGPSITGYSIAHELRSELSEVVLLPLIIDFIISQDYTNSVKRVEFAGLGIEVNLPTSVYNNVSGLGYEKLKLIPKGTAAVETTPSFTASRSVFIDDPAPLPSGQYESIQVSPQTGISTGTIIVIIVVTIVSLLLLVGIGVGISFALRKGNPTASSTNMLGGSAYPQQQQMYASSSQQHPYFSGLPTGGVGGGTAVFL